MTRDIKHNPAINKDVWLNASTVILSCATYPPVNTVRRVAATADPLAPIICLTVLLIAVASSIFPFATDKVQVTAGIKPKPAPIALII